MKPEEVTSAVQRFLCAGGVVTVVKPGRAAGIPPVRMKTHTTFVRRVTTAVNQGYALMNYSKFSDR